MGRGIGRATAAHYGAAVVLNDIDADRAHAAAGGLAAARLVATAVPGDLWAFVELNLIAHVSATKAAPPGSSRRSRSS